MLGKLLVGLLAAATIAVGSFYYLDTPDNLDRASSPSAVKRSSCSNRSDAAAVLATATVGPEGCYALDTSTEYRSPEVIAVAPRVVESELAPLPREAR